MDNKSINDLIAEGLEVDSYQSWDTQDEQTQKWHQSRVGKLTGSRFGDMMTRADGVRKWFNIDDCAQFFPHGQTMKLAALYELAKAQKGKRWAQMKDSTQQVHIDFLATQPEFKTPPSYGDKCLKLIAEKRAELQTGYPAHEPVYSAALNWGNNHEAEAFDYLSKALGDDWRMLPVGKNFFEINIYAGTTPDLCFINEDTLRVVQVKCPWNSGVFTEFCQGGKFKNDYFWQTIGDAEAAKLNLGQIGRLNGVSVDASVDRTTEAWLAYYDPRRPKGRRLAYVDMTASYSLHKLELIHRTVEVGRLISKSILKRAEGVAVL